MSSGRAGAGLKNYLEKDAEFLAGLFHMAGSFGIARPRVAVCYPAWSGGNERRARAMAVRQAGASATALVPEPLAAAIGSGLDVSLPYAQMIVDIGDGRTDISVIREGSIVFSRSALTAGSQIRDSVQKMVLENCGVEISRDASELLIHELGAVQGSPQGSLTVAGRKHDGRHGYVTVSAGEVCAAIKPVAVFIVDHVLAAVREMPAKEGVEVVETGICLSGGVANLNGLSELISERTYLPVTAPAEPELSVIKGAGRMLTTVRQIGLWECEGGYPAGTQMAPKHG